ncbi:MAG: hypothetical protein HFJ35_02490 [Clostridia bacterium]|nr:hypothetical protein [Clostridia bacterium]
MKNKKFEIIVATVMIIFIVVMVFTFSDDKNLQKEVIEKVTDVEIYEMSEEAVKELPTTEIIEQTEEQEKEVSEEQEVESEEFKLQGEVAYNGTTEYPNVSLGNYIELTYYSQIDQRWANKMYSSIGNSTQTIGTSGCRTNFGGNDCNSNKRCNYTRSNG